MSKHTHGPWVVQKHEGQLYIVAEQGKKWDNPTICNLYDDVTPSDSVTIGPWLEGHENAEANARLIAAAPDLLDALLNALPYVEDVLADKVQLGCFKPGIVEKHAASIRAAIAKATGEQ